MDTYNTRRCIHLIFLNTYWQNPVHILYIYVYYTRMYTASTVALLTYKLTFVGGEGMLKRLLIYIRKFYPILYISVALTSQSLLTSAPAASGRPAMLAGGCLYIQ
jgi:hypothetical protein